MHDTFYNRVISRERWLCSSTSMVRPLFAKRPYISTAYNTTVPHRGSHSTGNNSADEIDRDSFCLARVPQDTTQVLLCDDRRCHNERGSSTCLRCIWRTQHPFSNAAGDTGLLRMCCWLFDAKTLLVKENETTWDSKLTDRGKERREVCTDHLIASAGTRWWVGGEKKKAQRKQRIPFISLLSSRIFSFTQAEWNSSNNSLSSKSQTIIGIFYLNLALCLL